MAQIKHVLQWHITHKCNLRCKHCYQEDYQKDLSLTECLHILQQYHKYIDENHFKGHINFTGGEPMLSPVLFPLLEQCESLGITFGLLTNGTLLTREKVNKLSKYKMLQFVQVSIDGVKKTHEFIRGEGSWNKTWQGCRLLRKAGIQTMVSFTCHQLNYQELSSVIRTVRLHRIDRFWTDRLIPIEQDREIGKDLLVTTEQYRQVVSLLQRESLKRGPFYKTVIHTNRALQFDFAGNDCIYQCSAGKNLLTILADGTLLACRRLPISIGNVRQSTMTELVQESPLIQQLTNANGPDDCQNCVKEKECKGGAKCLTYAIYGDLNHKDVNCFY